MTAFYSWDGVGSKHSLVLTTAVTLHGREKRHGQLPLPARRVCPEMVPGSCSVIKGRNHLGKGEQRVRKPHKQGVRGQAIFVCFMVEKLRHRETK